MWIDKAAQGNMYPRRSMNLRGFEKGVAPPLGQQCLLQLRQA